MSFVTPTSSNSDDIKGLVCVVVTGGRQESFRFLVPLYETLAFLSGIAVIGHAVEDSFFERFVRLVGRGRDFRLGRRSLL